MSTEQIKRALDSEFTQWIYGPQSPVPAVLDTLRTTGALMPELPQPSGTSTRGQLMWKVDGDFAVVVKSFQQKIGIRIGRGKEYQEISREQAHELLSALAAALSNESEISYDTI